MANFEELLQRLILKEADQAFKEYFVMKLGQVEWQGQYYFLAGYFTVEVERPSFPRPLLVHQLAQEVIALQSNFGSILDLVK